MKTRAQLRELPPSPCTIKRAGPYHTMIKARRAAATEETECDGLEVPADTINGHHVDGGDFNLLAGLWGVNNLIRGNSKGHVLRAVL